MTILSLLLAASLSTAHALAPMRAPAPVSPQAVKQIKLTALINTPKTYILSWDVSMSAVAGEKAVTVWSLPTGKPLFRIEMPHMASTGPNDLFAFTPLSFSPDGRHLLAAMEHRRSDAEKRWTDSKVQLVLVSIAEEKIVKTIYTIDGPCTSNYSIRTNCAQIRDANFTTDGRHLVIVETRRYLPGYTSMPGDVKWTDASVALTLEGQKLMEESKTMAHRDAPNGGGEIVEESAAPNPQMQEFGQLDGDGRVLSVSKDKDTCALMDLTAKKRIAFLDGCTENDYPSLVADRGLVYSYNSETPDFRIWELDGTIRASFPREAAMTMRPHGDGRYVVANSSYGAPVQWSIFETSTGRKIATSSDPLFRVYAALTPDRRHIAAFGDDKVVYAAIDAGTPLQPSAPAALPSLGEPVANAAPASARTPAPAAPARSFDSPPASTSPTEADAYAVIIGVEKYRAAGIPRVDYASRDAKTMYDYATGAMGFDAKNVVLLTDDQATKTDFEKTLGSWLKNRVGAKSRVFVYYAGHGSPNPATGEGYLMPYEADPNYLEDTAYPVAKLYAALAKLPTKDVTVVLDACFSGQGGRSLIAKGARPLVSIVTAKAASNTVVLAAAESSQISASNPERRHGLLTSYLLEALNGAADVDGDGNIMSSEIYAFVRPAVERAARLQNLEQTPTMTPSPEALKAKPGRPWISLSAKK
jgi:hypothetical protein